MKKIIFSLVMIILLTAGNAFAARDILVFFDVSGSTPRATITEYFNQYRSIIVKNMSEGDSIASGLINSNTRGSFKPMGAIKIRKKGALESSTGYKEEMDSLRTRGLTTVKNKLEETKPSGSTDILSVLSQAKTYFASSGNDGQKVLLIFSDMVEETKVLNLSKLKNTDQVSSLYNKVSKNIPKLNGVNIYAVGAVGNGPNGFAALEAFWKQVFSESGASCVLFDHSISKF